MNEKKMSTVGEGDSGGKELRQRESSQKATQSFKGHAVSIRINICVTDS